MKNESHGGTAVAPRKAERLAAEDRWTFDGYEVHPLARYTPFFSTRQREQLEEQIRQCGSPPVLKHGEEILGDHNIIRACQAMGVEVHYVEWDGDGSLGQTVARSMVWPGQLDPSRRSALAVPVSEQLRLEIQPRRYGNLTEAAAAGKPSFLAKNPNLHICANSGKDGQDAGVHSAKIAADLFQVSESAVNQARHLWKEFPDLFNDLLIGRVNLSQARFQASRRKNQKKLAGISGNPSKRNQSGGEDELIVGDCVAVMRKWTEAPGGGMDLIFADPPYNIGWKYHADTCGDLMSEGGYEQFLDAWIPHCARLLKPDGSIFVMINGTWQDRICAKLRGQGLHLRAPIVWHVNFPNQQTNNFSTAARFILYFTRDRKRFTWNPDSIRVPSVRDRIGDARRTHEDGIVPHDVWDDIPMVPGNGGERVPWDDAPPQVPAALLERCILAASNPGDRVFDPFTGNGTTWKAARKLGRAFTGIERSPLYAEQARRWAMG